MSPFRSSPGRTKEGQLAVYEIIPLFAGILIGFGFLRLGPFDQRTRAIILVPAALVIGWIAATVSGEIEESWAFVLFDAAQVVVAAVLAAWLLGRAGLGARTSGHR